MAKKSKAQSPFAGRWRITSMEQWDRRSRSRVVLTCRQRESENVRSEDGLMPAPAGPGALRRSAAERVNRAVIPRVSPEHLSRQRIRPSAVNSESRQMDKNIIDTPLI